jgi:hypothetical protein
MKKMLVILALGLMTLVTNAAETDRDRLTYTGSRGNQSLDLNTETMRTEYRWVQVPYQERVCRYETRYRRECRQEPGRRICRTENRQVCERRRVCRTGRDGRQVCRDRRVCRNVPRRVCSQEPGRRVCRDVPYQEQVCRYETRYRQERRAFQVVDNRTRAMLNFLFNTIGDDTGLRTEVSANLNRHRLDVTAEDFSSPRRVLLASKSGDRSQNGTDTLITENYRIDLKSADRLFSPLRRGYTCSEVIQGRVEIETGEVFHPEDVKARLKVTAEGNVLFDRELTSVDYRWVNANGVSRAIVDLRAVLGGDYTGRTLLVDWTLSLPRGRALNANQFPEWSRSQSFSRVWR